MQRHISRPPVLPGSPGFARAIAVIQLFVLTRIQFVGDPTDVRLALVEESRPKDGGVRFVCLFVCLFLFLLTAHSYRPLPLSKMPIVVSAFRFLTIGRCRVTCGMSISTVVMLLVGS